MMVSQNNVGADIIRPFFYWMGLQSLHHRLRDATSLCTREAVGSAEGGGEIIPDRL